MTQVIVLLRGVNVGGRNRVPMATFREVLGALGLYDVRTLLNSGNAVARVHAGSWERLATLIRTTLAETLHVDVPVVVVPADTLQDIMAENTISASPLDASRLLVAFTQHPAALLPLSNISPLLDGEEQFVVGTHAAYLHCAQGIRDSKAAKALLGRAGQSVTTRNWATVLKLHTLLTSMNS